jgi:hypothetical protein
LVENATDLLQFARADLAGSERLQNKVTGGAVEEPVHEIADEVPLGLLGGDAGLVDVTAAFLGAADEAFLGHDLEKPQDGGVGERFIATGVDGIEHIANGRRAAVPEHAHDGELAVGGARKRRWFLAHGTLLLMR